MKKKDSQVYYRVLHQQVILTTKLLTETNHRVCFTI